MSKRFKKRARQCWGPQRKRPALCDRRAPFTGDEMVFVTGSAEPPPKAVDVLILGRTFRFDIRDGETATQMAERIADELRAMPDEEAS